MLTAPTVHRDPSIHLGTRTHTHTHTHALTRLHIHKTFHKFSLSSITPLALSLSSFIWNEASTKIPALYYTADVRCRCIYLYLFWFGSVRICRRKSFFMLTDGSNVFRLQQYAANRRIVCNKLFKTPAYHFRIGRVRVVPSLVRLLVHSMLPIHKYNSWQPYTHAHTLGMVQCEKVHMVKIRKFENSKITQRRAHI